MNSTRNSFLKVLPTLLLIMMAASPALDAALTVYKISGDISIRNARGWSALKRRAEIAPSDILRLRAGSKIEILDSKTRSLYSSVSTGDISVSSLIDAAKEDAASVTRKTNGKILASISENASSHKSRFGSTGLSMHDTDAGTSALTALNPDTPYLRQLMTLPADTPYDDYSDIVLIRRDIDGSDSTFNFAVFNTLDSPLYVNVIDQTDNGDINFYFNESPVVVPRGETVIRQYRYLLPEQPAGYIVIASDLPFTAADIRSILSGTSPTTANFFYSLLRL